MAHPGLKGIITEIHRRSLWQVLLIYVGGAWAVLELVDHVIERFAMPDWAYGFAVMLLLLGLPVVLATAFVQESLDTDGNTASDAVSARSLHPATTPETRRAPGPETAVADPPGDSGLRSALGRRMFSWRNAATGGVVAFALWGAFAAAWVLLAPADPAGSASLAPAERSDRKSVAVLPFANLSPDEANRFFADGVHEDVLTNLSRIADLRVTSRTSVLAYRDGVAGAREIAAELGVTAVVEGSVRREGDRVRVVVQLIDAEADEHLWAETYDRTLTDIFAVQSDIATRIATALEAELAPDETARIERVPTRDVAAYDLLQRSRLLSVTEPAENDQAIALLWRAIERDPSFGEAYASLAYRYSWRVTTGEPEVADSTVSLAERALALEPELAAAHQSLGRHYAWLGSHARADSAFHRALDLDPNATEVMNQLALSLVRRSRLDDALIWATRARDRDPNSIASRYWVAFVVMVLADESRAVPAVDDFDRRYPGGTATETFRIEIELDQGRIEDAWDRARALLRAHPEARSVQMIASDVALSADPHEALRLLRPLYEGAPEAESFNYYGRTFRTHYAYALLATGDTAEARPLIQDAIGYARSEVERGNETLFLRIELASLFAMLGDEEGALEWLERANAEGFAMPSLVRYDPLMAGLRNHPRFQAVVQAMTDRLEAQRDRVTSLGLWPEPAASP